MIVGSVRERDIGLDARGGLVLPAMTDAPGPNAVFSMLGLQVAARAMRARALYLPAANRRVVGIPGVPTVGTVHDLAQFHVDAKYGFARDIYIRHMLTPMLRRMSMVHAVSEATAEDVVKYADVPRARIRVVSNGISLATPTAAQTTWPRPFMIYPARLEHPGKNHLRLIEAFARSDARHTHDLLFSGKDWGAQERIEESIRTFGLQDRVSLLGFISREDLVGRMVEADAVVVAGLFEGFGLQAAEALALGRPLAYAATGSLPEVAGGHGARFDPHDVASIARALDKVAGDDVVRKHCRTSGPAYAKKFSWDACASSLADALVEVSREAA